MLVLAILAAAVDFAILLVRGRGLGSVVAHFIQLLVDLVQADFFGVKNQCQLVVVKVVIRIDDAFGVHDFFNAFFAHLAHTTYPKCGCGL